MHRVLCMGMVWAHVRQFRCLNKKEKTTLSAIKEKLQRQLTKRTLHFDLAMSRNWSHAVGVEMAARLIVGHMMVREAQGRHTVATMAAVRKLYRPKVGHEDAANSQLEFVVTYYYTTTTTTTTTTSTTTTSNQSS